MSEHLVAVHTIGQTPRPHLTKDLSLRFRAVRFEVLGALDDGPSHYPEAGSCGYPLETVLRDGTRVVVDASFLEQRLQALVSEADARVDAHVLLCAGPFPGLTAIRPLIRPFEASVDELRQEGLASLEVVVPFEAQAAPAAMKWEGAGFSCRTHVMPVEADETGIVEWISERLEETDAHALVFDYVGLPSSLVDEVRNSVDLPVFDLGQTALDTLESTLNAP
jgi:hypothetical protein